MRGRCRIAVRIKIDRDHTIAGAQDKLLTCRRTASGDRHTLACHNNDGCKRQRYESAKGHAGHIGQLQGLGERQNDTTPETLSGVDEQNLKRFSLPLQRPQMPWQSLS